VLVERPDLLAVLVRRHVRDRQVRARHGTGQVVGDERTGPLLVGEEVQHRHEQQGDRPVEVEQPGHLRRAEHRRRVEQVRLQHRHPRRIGQQQLAVRDRDRLGVHVHHPAVRVQPLRDLVHVAGGRDAGTEVEELVDAGRGQPPHRALQERPVGPGDVPDLRRDAQQRVRQLPVRFEVVRAAEKVVVHPGRVRAGVVHPVRRPVGAPSAHRPPPSCPTTVTEQSPYRR
jgi:hypothetical protein